MNLFRKLEMRRCTGSADFSAAHLNCLRLKRRSWFPHFGKNFCGSREIKKLLHLSSPEGPDAVCVMLQCDAEVWHVSTSTECLLPSLRSSPLEKISAVFYLRRSKTVLVYYCRGRRMDGVDPVDAFYRVRVMEVLAMQRGQLQLRDCPIQETQSTYLAHDLRNACLWLVEEFYISSWDDETLQLRFRIHEEPGLNQLRFGHGSLGQIIGSDNALISLFSADDGHLLGKVAVPGGNQGGNVQIVEVVSDMLLLCKREHSGACLVEDARVLCRLQETEDWLPERVESISHLGILLVLFPNRCEIWHFLRFGEGGVCWRGREIDAGTCVLHVSATALLFPLEKERGGCYSHDLLLLDLSYSLRRSRENPFCIVRNLSRRRGSGGAGVWQMDADLNAGVVLVLGQQGDLTCHVPDLAMPGLQVAGAT